jgi:hypothetical protein
MSELDITLFAILFKSRSTVCYRMPWAVETTIKTCQSLAELDARGIIGDVSVQNLPTTLRFVNIRHHECGGHRRDLMLPGCCVVMTCPNSVDLSQWEKQASANVSLRGL